MTNLFWKTKTKTKALLEKPFDTEEKFEKMVFNTKEILEDVFLIKRQVRGGNKEGIPDIIGIDNEGSVCIVEMKNKMVDATIISQVLKYAFWAENNPDSIKNIWLEYKDKPEDIDINWNKYSVRIIIIAPEILRSTVDITDKINYPVDLIEIKRWVEGRNQLLLLNEIEEVRKKASMSTGLETYDEQFYKSNYNTNSAKAFLRYVGEIENIVNEKGWNLEKKFNKHYCGFKAGFFNAFGVSWIGTKTLAFFFKLDKNQVKNYKIKMTRYKDQFNEAQFYIDPNKTKTKDFIPLFEKAYKRISGE